MDLCREKKGQSQFSRFDIKQGNVGKKMGMAIGHRPYMPACKPHSLLTFWPYGLSRVYNFPGDCWFLCSLAELTLHPDLFLFVCPEDNMANNDSHAYHFRLIIINDP